MDALCLVRIQDFGWRVSLFTVLNAAWLIPLYVTSPADDDDEAVQCIDDVIVSLSIAHVPSGSVRLIGSAIAAYLIFGYAMYAVWYEFQWYAEHRHKFLAKVKERNYSIYLRFLPEEYQSNSRLLNYFSGAAAVESNLVHKIPKLTTKVMERDAMLAKLEHAVNVQLVQDKTPMHSTSMCGGEKVESIPTYSKELYAMNQSLAKELNKLQGLDDSNVLQFTSTKKSSTDELLRQNESSNDDSEEMVGVESSSRLTLDQVPDELSAMLNRTNNDDGDDGDGEEQSSGFLARLLPDPDDGEKMNAAFVTFDSLVAARTALQTQHHEDPHTMESHEAPDPDDILWGNIGKDHKSVQIGTWLSFGLSSALLLFWTSVIAFASSLSSLDGLKSVGFIGSIIDKAPWLAPVLAQIAPFIVVIVQVLLKTILTMFSNLERPISNAMLESSLFTKLAWFMIIQNFFVLSLSGGVLTAYEEIIDKPTSAIELLATSLPSQSTFHTQILLVNVFISMSLELLRIVPVVIAKIRDLFGPGLTEKERSTAWMGLRPLNDPDVFPHASYASWNILYFMVLFVYGTIAPITSAFLALCFLIMATTFRHQFVYIYPTRPDSGGKLYRTFLNLILTCIVVAEVTVLGLYGIKLSPIASAMMIPLLIITIGYVMYVRQQHFLVSDHLPRRKAIVADCEIEIASLQFLKGAYTQPDLKVDPFAWPENMASPYDAAKSVSAPKSNDELHA